MAKTQRSQICWFDVTLRALWKILPTTGNRQPLLIVQMSIGEKEKQKDWKTSSYYGEQRAFTKLVNTSLLTCKFKFGQSPTYPKAIPQPSQSHSPKPFLTKDVLIQPFQSHSPKPFHIRDVLTIWMNTSRNRVKYYVLQLSIVSTLTLKFHSICYKACVYIKIWQFTLYMPWNIPLCFSIYPSTLQIKPHLARTF